MELEELTKPVENRSKIGRKSVNKWFFVMNQSELSSTLERHEKTFILKTEKWWTFTSPPSSSIFPLVFFCCFFFLFFSPSPPPPHPPSSSYSSSSSYHFSSLLSKAPRPTHLLFDENLPKSCRRREYSHQRLVQRANIVNMPILGFA